MHWSRRRLLIGRENPGYPRVRWLLLALGLFLSTFAGYALGVFEISGGVVFIPGDASLLGSAAALLVGYAHGGVLTAWLVSFGSLLGFKAYHAFVGLSYRSFPAQLAYFLELEGLFVLSVQGLLVGLIAYTVGSLVRRAVTMLR